MCVHIYTCTHTSLHSSKKKYLIPSLYRLPSVLFFGMREGKTEWDFESSHRERDIFWNQVSVQRTNALRKLSKGEQQFRVIKLFSNVVWTATADLCGGNKVLLPRGTGQEASRETQERIRNVWEFTRSTNYVGTPRMKIN